MNCHISCIMQRCIWRTDANRGWRGGRVSSQLYFGNSDVHSFTPLTALTEPQQLLCTHLDQVRTTWSQLPQLSTSCLKWPNLLEWKWFKGEKKKIFNNNKLSVSPKHQKRRKKKCFFWGATEFRCNLKYKKAVSDKFWRKIKMWNRFLKQTGTQLFFGGLL